MRQSLKIDDRWSEAQDEKDLHVQAVRTMEEVKVLLTNAKLDPSLLLVMRGDLQAHEVIALLVAVYGEEALIERVREIKKSLRSEDEPSAYDEIRAFHFMHTMHGVVAAERITRKDPTDA